MSLRVARIPIENFYKQSLSYLIMTEKEKKEKESLGDGLGVSGFTLGVLSIVFAGWIGLVIAIVGAAFCLVQQKNKKIRIAKLGLILSVIGFIVSLLFIFLYATLIASTTSFGSSIKVFSIKCRILSVSISKCYNFQII